MDRKQKLTLAGFGLLALLFVVLLVWGQTRPDCHSPGAKCGKDYAPGGGMKAIGRLFAGAGPGVELSQKRYDFATATLQTVPIAAADHQTRRLRVKWLQGALQLSLDNEPAADAPDLAGQRQLAALPRARENSDDPDDPDALLTQSYIVSRAGGHLSIVCVRPPCAVELE